MATINDDGKIIKWLINNGYNNQVSGLLNRYYKYGTDSISTVNTLGQISPIQDLYSFLGDIGEKREDPITAQQLHDELVNLVPGGNLVEATRGGRRRKTRKSKKSRKSRRRH